jgi:hypothetical protein
MTDIDLEEKARVRGFVRSKALEAISHSSENDRLTLSDSELSRTALEVTRFLRYDPYPEGGEFHLRAWVGRAIYEKLMRDLPKVRPGERSGVAVKGVPYLGDEGGRDTALRDLALAVIGMRSERDLQRMPGPSDLGDQCDVCVGGKIAQFLGMAEPAKRHIYAKTWIGTAVHEKLERDLPKVYGKAELEITVSIADLPGLGLISGHVDAYLPEVAALNDYKGLALDTKLPTPDGWTTMEEVSEGDTLLDSQGNPCKVIGKSAVHQRICYRVTFDDGTSVVCDDEHLWSTLSNEGKRLVQKVLNTEEIRNTLKRENGQIRHRVINTKPLDLPHADLPIDPYVLGCWLGDGSSGEGQICKPDEEMFKLIEGRGFKVGPLIGNGTKGRESSRPRTVYGLRTLLRECGLLGAKHIPKRYLRASREQRTDLLRGLMDTDGSWNKSRRHAVFTSVDKVFMDSVYELVVSLGQRPIVSTVQAKGFGKLVTAYVLSFTPVGDLNPFLSSVKAGRVQPLRGTSKTWRRGIHSVERTVTVPTQCLKVDSPDSTYLCTEAMIPTHNTSDLLGNFGLKKMRQSGVKAAYMQQTMLYCYGLRRSGVPVEWANLTFIPRDSYRESDIWTATCAYREDVAVSALERAQILVDVVRSGDSHTLKPDLDGPCFTCVVLPRIT